MAQSQLGENCQLFKFNTKISKGSVQWSALKTVFRRPGNNKKSKAKRKENLTA